MWSMRRQLLSIRALRIPICIPMSTTAKVMPRVYRANRTQSWVRLHQASGTRRGSGHGDSEQVCGVGHGHFSDGDEPRTDAHSHGQDQDQDHVEGREPHGEPGPFPNTS